MLTLLPPYSCITATRHRSFSHKPEDHFIAVELSQDTVFSPTNFRITIMLSSSHKTPCFVILTLLPLCSCRTVTIHRVLSSYKPEDHSIAVELPQNTVFSRANFGPSYSCRTVQDTLFYRTNVIATLQLWNRHKTPCFVMVALWSSYI